MSDDATLLLSPQPEAAQRPQNVTEQVAGFEDRVTRLLSGLADKVDGMQHRLDGTVLALAGITDRQTAVTPDSGFSAMPVDDAGQIPTASLQGEPVATTAARAAAEEPVTLPVAGAPVSLPAASSDVPLGPYTQAMQEKRQQPAQIYNGMTM